MESNSQFLSIALVQLDNSWESPTENLTLISELLLDYHDEASLFVLPEMCTTGFTMNASQMAPYAPDAIEYLQQISDKKDIAISCSLIVEDQGLYFNRFFTFSPHTPPYTYDKRHLFSYADEHLTYQQGKQRTTFDIMGWTVLPFVCYDIRFPVWLRNDMDYDLLLGVANFPAARIDAWTTLLKARAIENLSYTVGVNRIGEDPNVQYNGQSVVFDALGNEITRMGADEKLKIVVLDKDDVRKTRQKFAFNLDRDQFNIDY